MTFFGLATAGGCPAWCNVPGCICPGTPSPTPHLDGAGREIYTIGISSGFTVVVEARPGLSGATVGANLLPANPADRPDLQIQSTRNLGNGSAAVCDTQAPNSGGIPAIDPPSYAPGQTITDILRDWACRFEAFTNSQPCTSNAFGNPAVLSPSGLPSNGRQFCHQPVRVGVEDFPLNDTILTVQVRDTAGFIGPQKQIVVRRVQ